MKLINYKLIIVSFAMIAFFTACKKEQSDALAPIPTPTPSSGSSEDKLKDSALGYTRDIYLWYDQIPASFNARSYEDLNKLMTAIRQYSKEPGFTQPVDRWSFAMKQKDWDNVSSGIAGDFGLGVFFRNETDLRVKSVEAASPAGKAGIRRGWQIKKINGSETINTGNASFIVENVFNSNSTRFTFQKPDGSTVDVTLNAATYQEQPIMFDSVYQANSKKVGYLVFNSFLGDTTQIYNDFQRIFNRFAGENVTDVVVDLRYNGGGYVKVQEKLANYLVKSSANGNVMMKQEFNNKYTRYNSSTNFRKQGSLNADRIFFIVSSSTASASELLINNLKPYTDVVLVGPSKTYGKPVGFFPIEVGGWYIFPVSFRTTNKNGESSYFNGMSLNHQVADGLDKDWGDASESSFAAVLRYVNSGEFRMQSANGQGTRAYAESAQVREGNKIIDLPSFKGSIDTRQLK